MLVGGMLLVLLCSAPILAETRRPSLIPSPLERLVAEAKALRLPLNFLSRCRHFVTFEFEDLHAFAAEYHPADHRMVLIDRCR